MVSPLAGEIACGAACLTELHGAPTESMFNSLGSVELCVDSWFGTVALAHTKLTSL